MYSTVIEIKKNVTGDALNKIHWIAENAFSNRAGSIKNSSSDPYRFIFEGDEKDYGCLDLGVALLGETVNFISLVDTWNWFDDDPNEDCDILNVYADSLR